jgi:regulator of replication initiation timing
MNYEEAVKIIEKLSVENKRLKRRIEELQTQRKSTRRGRRSIINDEMIQKTQQLRNEGFSIRDIAIELGVSSYTAHKILHMNDSVSEFDTSIT